MENSTLVIDALLYEKHKAFGFQEYLFNLLDYFYENRDKIKFDKIIVICNQTQLNDLNKYRDRFQLIGFEIPNLIVRFYVQTFFIFKLKLKNSDVVLYLGNYSSLIKRSKSVLVIHDLLYLRRKFLPNIIMRIQRYLYVPLSIKMADVIIAISEFTKNDVEINYNFANNKIIKVYNYFNFNKFQSKSNINFDKTKYFLTVSSSARHKNTITVLKAFELYCQKYNECQLYIVGVFSDATTKNYYENMSQLAKDRIKIFSNVSNSFLTELYKNCLAFVSASFFEGLGMPIIEAMYFNKKVILSDISVFREITENQAVFFNPYSYNELYSCLIDVNYDIVNTKAFVLEKYSNYNTSEKYINIINSLKSIKNNNNNNVK